MRDLTVGEARALSLSTKPSDEFLSRVSYDAEFGCYVASDGRILTVINDKPGGTSRNVDGADLNRVAVAKKGTIENLGHEFGVIPRDGTAFGWRRAVEGAEKAGSVKYLTGWTVEVLAKLLKAAKALGADSIFIEQRTEPTTDYQRNPAFWRAKKDGLELGWGVTMPRFPTASR